MLYLFCYFKTCILSSTCYNDLYTLIFKKKHLSENPCIDPSPFKKEGEVKIIQHYHKQNAFLPVIAVDIIQPTTLLHYFNGTRNILPCSKTMSPFIFVTITGFNTSAIGSISFPISIIENTLLSF